jgi:predicted PurR-regulated permease PerM
MPTRPTQPYFLIALIGVSLVLTFFIFRPFLIVLILALVFAVVLQPLYRAVLRSMGTLPGLAAFLTMLLAVTCILVPLTFITKQIVLEAEHLHATLSETGERTYLDTALQSINDLVEDVAPSLALSDAEISSSIDTYTKNALEWLVQNLGGAFGGITRFVLGLFVFMIALYYFLRDGARLKKTIIALSPIRDEDDAMVIERLETAINSVIRGSLTIALIQGVLTGIGFTIFGVPNSILWGVVAAFAALIPGIGTSLVLVPGVAYLFVLGGGGGPAIGLLIWSVVVVGLIDNLLGPRLVGRGMRLHPLIVLLAVFGGLSFFGPAGVFLGPLCISLLVALLSIYPQTRAHLSHD